MSFVRVNSGWIPAKAKAVEERIDHDGQICVAYEHKHIAPGILVRFGPIPGMYFEYRLRPVSTKENKLIQLNFVNWTYFNLSLIEEIKNNEWPRMHFHFHFGAREIRFNQVGKQGL